MVWYSSDNGIGRYNILFSRNLQALIIKKILRNFILTNGKLNAFYLNIIDFFGVCLNKTKLFS